MTIDASETMEITLQELILQNDWLTGAVTHIVLRDL